MKCRVCIVALFLFSMSLMADPPSWVYRANYHFGSLDLSNQTINSYTKLIDNTQVYTRHTMRGSNWIVQNHSWGALYPGLVSLFLMTNNFHFARTNVDIPVASWDTNQYETGDPPWEFGVISYQDTNGVYRWRDSQMTIAVGRDTNSTASSYRLMVEFNPFRYWAPDNQAQNIYGRFVVPTNSLPKYITFNPCIYTTWSCSSINIDHPGPVPYPPCAPYIIRVSKSWVGSFVCSENDAGQSIPAPQIPYPDPSNPPLPENCPSPLVIKFDQTNWYNPQNLVPFPGEGNGCTNCPVVSFVTPEQNTKTMTITGINPSSHFVYFASSNLVDWSAWGLSSNTGDKHYEFTDNWASEGVRFYRFLNAD